MSEPTQLAPPATDRPPVPPMPPHVVATLAAVEVARAQVKALRQVVTAQLDTMDATLDAVLAAAQAGHYTLAMANSSLRERIAREAAPGGFPAVFGPTPGADNGNQRDPLGRLDSAP